MGRNEWRFLIISCLVSCVRPGVKGEFLTIDQLIQQTKPSCSARRDELCSQPSTFVANGRQANYSAQIHVSPASPQALVVGLSRLSLCVNVVSAYESDSNSNSTSSPSVKLTVSFDTGFSMVLATSAVEQRQRSRVADKRQTKLSNDAEFSDTVAGNSTAHNGDRQFECVEGEPNTTFCIQLEALTVGRVRMLIRLVEAGCRSSNVTLSEFPSVTEEEEIPGVIAVLEYLLVGVRRKRQVDAVFIWVVAIATLLNSFSLGCATQCHDVRRCFRNPTSVVIVAVCHSLVLPASAIAVAKLFVIESGLALGLFYVSCVPAGGFSYVITSLTKPNTVHSQTSAAVNLVAVYSSLVTTPLWIFTVEHFSLLNHATSATTASAEKWPMIQSQHLIPLEPELLVFELCQVANAVAHSLGLLTAHRSPDIADAFLAWFTRPFLLLSALVFSTVGLYINSFAFNVHSTLTLALVGFALPIVGHVTGSLASLIARLPSTPHRKQVAVESSVLNGALAITMVRLGVRSDVDADMYAAVAVLITCATPATWIGAGLVRRIVHLCGNGGAESVGTRIDVNKEKRGRSKDEVDGIDLVQQSTSILSKSRSQITQADELEISVIIVDEKVTVI